MSKATRRDFFKGILTKPEQKKENFSNYNIANDVVFNKYSNKSLPLNTKHTRSTLAPYVGVFTEKQKIHLLRRAMFGVNNTDFNNLTGLTASQAIDLLLNTVNTTIPDPVNWYQQDYADPQGIALGSTWINTAPENDGNLTSNRIESVKINWLRTILQQPTSIEEKMVLFWHNHFATQNSAVFECKLFNNYYNLLRTHALGNFKVFVKEITKNTMMLYYLNGAYNNVGSPDENYARELQELFTIGKAPNRFTEDDVQMAAKVLTGHTANLWWPVATNASYTASYFDGNLHDTSTKTFSAFYNNTVINGQMGAAGANELDELLDMIFSKSVLVSEFICRKIYRFFMHYDVDATIETNIIVPLAQTLVTNNWDIKPVIEELFKSDHFFDAANMDCHIKSPIDHSIGLLRTAHVALPPITQLYNNSVALRGLGWVLQNNAFTIGDPPNVAGWAAYRQAPQFHQVWINSDTTPKRIQHSDNIFSSWGQWVAPNMFVKSNVIAFAQDCASPGDPEILVDFFISRLLSFTLSAARKTELKSILLSGQTANYYWTDAWFDYLANLTDLTKKGIVEWRLQQCLTQIMRKAESQIG